MVDRSYLPFKAARDYQDVGMQKWAGFFLSEHNTSLTRDREHKEFRSSLSLKTKYFLLNQAYSQQCLVNIFYQQDNKLTCYSGQISSFDKDFMLIKTAIGFNKLVLENIINITLGEE